MELCNSWLLSAYAIDFVVFFVKTMFLELVGDYCGNKLSAKTAHKPRKPSGGAMGQPGHGNGLWGLWWLLWCVAADVCTALDLANVSMAMSRLDDDEKLLRTVFVAGQSREVLTINESGLYNLIFTSRKEEAKRFKKWVTQSVEHGAV